MSLAQQRCWYGASAGTCHLQQSNISLFKMCQTDSEAALPLTESIFGIMIKWF